jgi:molecular chaperone DnaK (HSP70)
MRLWIDDLRDPPDDTWIWAKTSTEALHALATRQVTEVSFDHDLGGDDTTMRVANYIERLAAQGRRAPPKWSVHSANPVGKENLIRTLSSAERLWIKVTISKKRA